MKLTTGLDAPPTRAVHLFGILSVVIGVGLGLAVFAWISGPATVQASWLTSRPSHAVVAPRPAVGLVERSDNRGQVLFGRYCDSCHTAGRETSLGPSLRSAQFKRQFRSEEQIARVIREGGFDMPAFGADRIAEEDLTVIAAYVLSLPPENP